MAQSKTKPSTRRLSEVARHVIPPSGIISTGWPAVEAKCQEFGDTFDEWQRGAGKLILAKRADGSYAATVGGITLSIPRQVAKTFLVGRIIFALCVLFPGLKVLWTAHRTRTSTQTFRTLSGFAKRSKVAPYLMPGPSNGIRTTNGEQEIAFANGSIIMFGARELGFGRGFDEVDVEVFDEAQILTDKALEDMVAATNQSRHPHGALLFYMGTPPRPVDPGEVFKARRQEALAGESEDALYIECSADPDAKLDDRAQWAKANPSFPHRTPLRSMLRLRKNLRNDDSWRREGLGIWDDETNAGAIPRWIELGDPASCVTSNATWALAVSPIELGAQWASFGHSGRRADGRLHVEVLEHRAGTWWVVEYAKAGYAEKQIPLRVRTTGAEGALIKQLVEAGVEVEEVSVTDATQACGALVDAAGFKKIETETGDVVEMPQMHHLNDPDLNRAVRGARLRTSSQGGSQWDELKSAVELSALIAVTVAAGGVPAASEPSWVFV